MGQRTDARIRAWQEETGITPARGTRLQILNDMSRLAYELIQILELEKSGIRDGDGSWYGCVPYSSVIEELYRLERVDLTATWRRPGANGVCPGDAGGCMGDCDVCARKRREIERTGATT
jgi:hypothetical protein